MKKSIALICVMLLLCIGLSACRVNYTYNPSLVRAFRRELKSEYDCVKSLSLSTWVEGLSTECKIEAGTAFSEILAVYNTLADFLSNEELLNHYLDKAGAEYGATPPPTPVVTNDSGLRISLYLYVGDDDNYDYYVSVSLTKPQDNVDETGYIWRSYVYNGFPGWPDELVFHEESITSESVILTEIPRSSKTATCDFDGDGIEETIVSVGKGSDVQLCMLEPDGDGFSQRTLINNALADLLREYCYIANYWGGDTLGIVVPNEVFQSPSASYVDSGGELHELAIQVEISTFLISENDIEAYARFCLEDLDVGKAELLGGVWIPLIYDDELGFRVANVSS